MRLNRRRASSSLMIPPSWLPSISRFTAAIQPSQRVEQEEGGGRWGRREWWSRVEKATEGIEGGDNVSLHRLRIRPCRYPGSTHSCCCQNGGRSLCKHIRSSRKTHKAGGMLQKTDERGDRGDEV
eukprot:747153-Hanusia_phi.AAC.3